MVQIDLIIYEEDKFSTLEFLHFAKPTVVKFMEMINLEKCKFDVYINFKNGNSFNMYDRIKIDFDEIIDEVISCDFSTTSIEMLQVKITQDYCTA